MHQAGSIGGNLGSRMQLTHADIMAMRPEDAARELADTCSKLPLLMTRAGMVPKTTAKLSVREIAARLNISETTVREHAASDPLWKDFSKKVGGQWRFDRAEFERIVSEGKSRQLL